MLVGPLILLLIKQKKEREEVDAAFGEGKE